MYSQKEDKFIPLPCLIQTCYRPLELRQYRSLLQKQSCDQKTFRQEKEFFLLIMYLYRWLVCLNVIFLTVWVSIKNIRTDFWCSTFIIIIIFRYIFTKIICRMNWENNNLVIYRNCAFVTENVTYCSVIFSKKFCTYPLVDKSFI
jgi:hypothetical protein